LAKATVDFLVRENDLVVAFEHFYGVGGTFSFKFESVGFQSCIEREKKASGVAIFLEMTGTLQNLYI
jgi:hypothetical protein